MYKVRVIFYDGPDEVEYEEHEYDEKPTVVIVKTQGDGLREAMANDYADWLSLFDADFNVV